MVHCLFEQSGTFKNAFKKLGMEAQDYDILNDFEQTDNVIDLFTEINNGYIYMPSIFDKINKDDLIIAFFPCIRFEDQIKMRFRGDQSQQKNWTLEQKLEEDILLHNQLNDLYCLITKLVIVCVRKNLKLIIENPYSSTHHLRMYWCIKPSIIDMDRTTRGDWFKKPTQYWFINCKPKHNFIFGKEKQCDAKRNAYCNTVERSLINHIYAERFIKEFIL